MNRRNFLKSVTGSGLYVAMAAPLSYLQSMETDTEGVNSSELSADLVIIGGSLGGCAAALSAVRSGLSVILTEETDWIGGQLTSQGVPPDEHQWIEQFGGTRTYRELRTNIRNYYREWYPLTGSAYRNQHLNPGNGAVSRLCHEPQVALRVLQSMLQPYVSSGSLQILLHCTPVRAERQNGSVKAVDVRDLRDDTVTTLAGDYFVDATELGDLLPLADVSYVTGAESRVDTGEPHAAGQTEPLNMQAITWCFALEHRENENHVIDKPENYDFWKNYVPELDPRYSGKLLSWTYSNPRTLEPRTLSFDPVHPAGTKNFNLWRYRRIIDPANFAPGHYQSGITLVNYPQNDYFLGNLLEIDEGKVQENLRQARELSYSLVYWMQTEAPREDGGAGWPGLRLRGDLMGTRDGLAKYPYIRESRRIKAEVTVTELHVGTEARMERTNLPVGEVTAYQFNDSVGVGSYRIDLHPSTGGDNYIDISSLPFQIPLGALIPEDTENLLPACKNIGTTHITNGCYRLHPVEWNIGESVGYLAAFCLDNKELPRHIRNTSSLLSEFQNFIRSKGMETHWPKPVTTAK